MSHPVSRISIVLPVQNQADHLEGLIRECRDGLDKVPVPAELILVENGSSDDSLARARALAAQVDGVRVIEADRAGWGHAVRLGLAAADGDLICYTNSARTSADDLVLVLLYALAYPGVVIKVNRRIRASWGRRVGSLLYNLQCRVLFDLLCWDINGTPKVFPRSCDRLLALTRDDDLIDLEFNIICRTAGYRMLEVPILSTRRHGGRSTTNLGTALRLYWGAYRLWRSRP